MKVISICKQIREKVMQGLSIAVPLVIITSYLIPVLPAMAAPPEWIVDGDTVYVDTSKAYMSATPHTLYSSGWVEFELTTKSYTGPIDMVWGFDDIDGAVPRNPQVWRPYLHFLTRDVLVERVASIDVTNVTLNEVLEPGSVAPDLGNTNNSDLRRIVCDQFPEPTVIAFSSYTGDLQAGTVTYNYDNMERETYTATYPDWKPWSGMQESRLQLAGANKWYTSTNLFVTAGVDYKMRVWVDVPFNKGQAVDGKYSWAVKPSHQTIAEAQAAGNLYLLDPWWNASWTNRNVLSFNGTTISENLTDFPVTVHFDASWFDFTAVNEDGSDIRFLDSDEVTLLDFELEAFNGTTSTGWAHVRVPQVDANSDFTDWFSVYYGNAGASDGQNAAGTWNAEYVLVDHLTDNSANTTAGSTSYNGTGTKKGANEPVEIPATIYRGQAFDDTDDHLTFTSAANITLWAGTYEVINTLNGTQYGSIFGLETGGARFLSLENANVFLMRTNTSSYRQWNVADPVDTADGNPHHLAVTLNGTGLASDQNTFILYADGQVQSINATVVNQVPVNPNIVRLGTSGAGVRPIGATMDEVRVSNVVRSPEWVETTYRSLFNQLLYYGDNTSEPAVTTNAATGVTMDAAGVTGGTFNGNLTSMGGDPVSANVSFGYGTTNSSEASTAASAVTATGAFTVPIPGTLLPDNTYVFRAVGQNGQGTGYGDNLTMTFTMPTVTTGTGVVSGSNVLLSGDITNMGVASTTFVYFEYGPTASYGSTTALVEQGAVASFQASIPAPGADITLFYRAVAQNGAATVFGAGTSMTVQSASGGFLLDTLLPLVIAALLCVGVIRVTNNPMLAFIFATVGLIGFYIIQSLLGTL